MVVSEQLLIWGGVREGRDPGCVQTAGADVHSFSLASKAWTVVAGEKDSSRSSHAAVAYRNKVLFCGGKFGTSKGVKDGLNFITIKGAGHMAPQWKPQASFEMSQGSSRENV